MISAAEVGLSSPSRIHSSILFWLIKATSLSNIIRVPEREILPDFQQSKVENLRLEEKLNGSVHIAIGMNDHLGGQNHSNLHLDLVMLHPSLWLDGILFNLVI